MIYEEMFMKKYFLFVAAIALAAASITCKLPKSPAEKTNPPRTRWNYAAYSRYTDLYRNI